MVLHTSDEVRLARRKGIFLSVLGCAVLAAVVIGATVWYRSPTPEANEPLPVSGDDLFNPLKVHKIHLIFTADNWEAMEPDRKGGMVIVSHV